MGKPGGDPYEFLAAKEYGDFLIRLHDMWRRDLESGRYVYIRLFENLMMLMSGLMPEECGACGVCSEQYLIEADGSVYPCDFYVEERFLLGNILSDPIEKLKEAQIKTAFTASSWQLPEQCGSCRFIDLCRGGCKRYRDCKGLFLYCSSYRNFLEHSVKGFNELLEKYR